MALMNFIKKQFIDVIEWTDDDGDTLAWRFPMADMEIQNGAVLVVRPGQLALFVNEGRAADVFGPGSHTLGTRTLPVLTNLKHWDKLFASPFKSDVVFFSTRQQVDQKWGTAQPITLRDAEFGAVRVRAFGNVSYRVAEPRRFVTEIVGSRARYQASDIDGQLRALVLQQLSTVVATSGIAFLDLAANLPRFAQVLTTQLKPAFDNLGLQLDGMTVQSVSLPDELQKVLDQKIGMGMVGDDMARLMQYQSAQAISQMAAGGAGGGSALAGDAMGLGAGMAMGQVLAQNLTSGLQAAAAGQSAEVKPADVIATLEKLGELKAKGVLTQQEFDAKKTDLLKKLV